MKTTTTHQIKEFETQIGKIDLFQACACMVDVTAEFERGYPEIRQSFKSAGEPGEPDSCEITSIKLNSPMAFTAGDDDSKIFMTLQPGTDVLGLFVDAAIDELEAEIVSSFETV